MDFFLPPPPHLHFRWFVCLVKEAIQFQVPLKRSSSELITDVIHFDKEITSHGAR